MQIKMSSFLKPLQETLYKMEANILKSKFRGCFLGSLLGDCLGAPYEGDIVSSGDKIILQRYFDKLETEDLKGPYRKYTDDTAMMKSVATTLIENPEVDYVCMAKLFVKEYFAEPHRGYGQNVVEVFQKLRKTKFEDVFKPAKEQFNGTGSYGNGGAMRIAPVSLLFHNNTNMLIEVTRKTTQLTHTNPLGIHGAILQSLAISEALHHIPETKPIQVNDFIGKLKQKIALIEAENDDGLGLGDSTPYQDKLKFVEQFLNTKYSDELDDQVIEKLGNSISALGSVPTAIYCFLRAFQNDNPAIQTDNIFRRTIQYGISLGGDTDTIACMAGAIAGAYLGEEKINKNLIKQCELADAIVTYADELFVVAQNRM